MGLIFEISIFQFCDSNLLLAEMDFCIPEIIQGSLVDFRLCLTQRYKPINQWINSRLKQDQRRILKYCLTVGQSNTYR